MRSVTLIIALTLSSFLTVDTASAHGFAHNQHHLINRLKQKLRQTEQELLQLKQEYGRSVGEATRQYSEAARKYSETAHKHSKIQLGPRPFFLVEDMDQSPLKARLQACESGPFYPSRFSIGHRGAPLQFPEHTLESYIAAARMGAGIIECDVTFTRDRELVCRHAQCDLHTTTNILTTPLAEKCTVPPEFDRGGNLINAADINCCTSDITVSEFKSLQGKIDSANTSATSIEEYMGAAPGWRTGLYASRGTLLTHAESIALFDALGADFIPELKQPQTAMPFAGGTSLQGDNRRAYTQQDYAQQLIDEYKAAGIEPHRVWPQSFNYRDVLYWIKNNPDFGKQAVYLDGIYDLDTTMATMESWVSDGVQVLAPPMWMLLDVDGSARIVPSQYALNARAAGLKLIAWTIERSGPLNDGGGWYYQTTNGDRGGIPLINNSGDMMDVLHVLANDVGIIGIFSDWPATTTYYANCMGLK